MKEYVSQPYAGILPTVNNEPANSKTLISEVQRYFNGTGLDLVFLTSVDKFISDEMEPGN